MKKRARYYDGKGNELMLDEDDNGIRITIVKERLRGNSDSCSILIPDNGLQNLIDMYYKADGKRALSKLEIR